MTNQDVPGPLSYAAFRWLLAGRTASMFGNAVAPVVLAFAVLDLTGSVRDLGLVVGARSLANVLFLLAGGVIADRVSRSLVMVSAGSAAAITQAVLATIVLTDIATVPLLMALAAANGTVTAFAFPAAAALLPQTVPPEIRQRANALNRLGINGAMIGGAATGGALSALIGPGRGMAVNTATFALAAAFFALVRVADVRDRTAPRQRLLRDMREGWTEFASRRWLWVVVLGFMLLNAAFTGAVLVLGPAVADETVGRQAWGLVLAAQSAGMALGAVIAMHVRTTRLLLYGVAAIASQVLLVLGLALLPRMAILLIAALLAGLGTAQFGVAWETTMQEHIPADKLARVYSYDALGSFVALPIGQIAVGPVAAVIGTKAALLVGASIMVAVLIGMIVNRDVRNLRHRLPEASATGPAQ